MMLRNLFLVKVRFRGRFTSYSPAVAEGFIDSTTLHAALVSAAILAGYDVEELEFTVTSLLPVLECLEEEIGLIPPLRLPGSNRVSGFWTPKATSNALRVILESPVEALKTLTIKPKDVYNQGPCKVSGVESRSVALKVDSDVRAEFCDTDRRLITLPDEVKCVEAFIPPSIMRHHRLAIDRITQTATPIMYSVVAAPRTLYWAAGLTNDCSLIEATVSVVKKLGLGALKSTGHGSLEWAEFYCGNEAEKTLQRLLGGLRLYEAGNAEGVLLGLFKPEEGAVQDAYGEVWVYGSHKGYGGFLQSLRRPVVEALAPGSIVTRAPHPRGLTYRSPNGGLVYSFHTLVAGVVG